MFSTLLPRDFHLHHSRFFSFSESPPVVPSSIDGFPLSSIERGGGGGGGGDGGARSSKRKLGFSQNQIP